MGAQRRAWVALCLAFAVGGCAEQKSSYTFEGCPIDDGVCSRDITLACAVNAIDRQYSACMKDEDCVEPPQFDWECVPVTFCRKRLINRVNLEQYVTDVGNELDRYCSEINCGWFTDDACAGPPGDRAACVEGQCRWVTSDGVDPAASSDGSTQ